MKKDDKLKDLFDKIKDAENKNPNYKYPRHLMMKTKFGFIIKIWNWLVERIMNRNV